jgi:hypothetical protein
VTPAPPSAGPVATAPVPPPPSAVTPSPAPVPVPPAVASRVAAPPIVLPSQQPPVAAAPIVLPSTQQRPAPKMAAVSAARQLVTAQQKPKPVRKPLPFTGAAAGEYLFPGVALISLGLLLRWRRFIRPPSRQR